LEISGMIIPYWLMLFSVSCAANLIGLNASSAFNSAITVYILIPILLIPQMILSGAMFNFDKINDLVKNKAKVPLLADLMVSRWAYEGLSVYQYSNNKYANRFYELEKVEQVMLFNIVFGIPHMRTGLNTLHDKFVSKTISNNDIQQFYHPALEFVLTNSNLLNLTDDDVSSMKRIFEEVKLSNIDQLQRHLLMLDERMNVIYNLTVDKEDRLVEAIDVKFGEGYALKLKDQFYNESLAEVVRNLNTISKVTVYKSHLIPKTENIYFYPIYSDSEWDYRSHFYAPVKKMFNHYVSTFTFNVLLIWCMTMLFFLLLYLNGLSKLFSLFKQLVNK
jgi:ABC transport system ATP-binding/permease protein